MIVVIRVILFLHTLLFVSTPCLFPSKLTFRVLVRKKSATFVILVRSCLEAHISGSGLEWSSVKVNLKAEGWWLPKWFLSMLRPLKTPKDIQASCSRCTQPRNETRCAYFPDTEMSLMTNGLHTVCRMLAVHHTQACTCGHIAVGHVHIYSNSQREMGGDREVITGVDLISCKECFFLACRPKPLQLKAKENIKVSIKKSNLGISWLI